MPNNVINKIKLPNADVYDLQDANALPKTTTINNVSKALDANTYTLTGDDIKLSGSYVVPQTYTPPVAGVTSVEDSIANLVKHVDDVVSGGVTSVDEAPTSHLNITTTDGAVTVDVAQGYVIPPSTVQTPVSGGSTVSLVSTGDMDTWNNKQSSIKVGSSAVADANHVTTFAEGANVDITAENGTITIAATDTTYSTFDATHAGLAPAGGTTVGFLKNDGSWATPHDTTYTEGTGIDISNANVISNTGVTAVTESNSSTGTNGTISVTTNGTTEEVAVKGLNTAAYKDVDTVIDTANPSTKLPTSAAVNTAITNAVNALPEPMVFKGTVSGTYPATPSVGDTYKATANSNSGVTPAYKIGDTVIYSEPSTGTFEWTVIPSGDEPSGTVTSITGSDGVITTNDTTGSSTISTSGTVKLSLVSTHTTTVNAGAATSTANRSYPLAIDGNNKLAVNVPWENTTYEFADSYNASTNKGATVATVTNAINALDVTESSVGATKTIASWKQENGAVAITTQDISIPITQVNNVSANNTAVTGVSATTATSGTGYVGMCSYDSTTKTLTINNLLAPTANTFVKKTS